MYGNSQRSGWSLDQWDEEVGRILEEGRSRTGEPALEALNRAYRAVVNKFPDLDYRSRNLLLDMEVTLIRQNDPGAESSTSGQSIDENGELDFWQTANQETTAELQGILKYNDVEEWVAELYEVAEFGQRFSGNSKCTKICSSGRVQTICC